MTREEQGTPGEEPGRRRGEVLAVCVRDALEEYFGHLGDYEPSNLYQLVLAELERPLFESVMKRCGGNQTQAARILGISRGTLRKKLVQYEIG